MLSTCPNCLNQINHPSEISQVKCTDCGTEFAAFLKVNLEEHTDEHSSPGAESPSFDSSPPSFDQSPPAFEAPPSFDQSPPAFDQAAPSFDQSPPSFEQSTPSFDPAPPAAEPAPSFLDLTPPEPVTMGAEPTSMGGSGGGEFAEATAAFAEIRDFGETLEDKGKAKAQAKSAPQASNEAQPVPTPVLKSGGHLLMTSGDLLQNHTIVEYLSPVSVLSALAPGDNPMQPAFVALRDQAARLGGNAVVALRWSLSGDASKVLVSGTAVKCTKS
jgi:hypothetical protein